MKYKKEIITLILISILFLTNISTCSSTAYNLKSCTNPDAELTILDQYGNEIGEEFSEGKFLITETVTKEKGEIYEQIYYLKNTGEQGSNLYIELLTWDEENLSGAISWDFEEPIPYDETYELFFSYNIINTKIQEKQQELILLIKNEDPDKDQDASERYNRYYIQFCFTITGSKDMTKEKTKFNKIFEYLELRFPIVYSLLSKKNWSLNIS